MITTRDGVAVVTNLVMMYLEAYERNDKEAGDWLAKVVEEY